MASREPPDCLACSAISSSSDSGPGLMVVSSDGGRLVPESRRLRCRRPKLSGNPRLEIAPPEAPFIPVPDRRQDARQRDTPQAGISQEALHDLLAGNQIVFFEHSHEHRPWNFVEIAATGAVMKRVPQQPGLAARSNCLSRSLVSGRTSSYGIATVARIFG